VAAIDLRKQAMTAAATLLGLTPTAHGASQDRWTWDTSFLQYNEAERISVSEPQVGVRRDYGDNRSLSILATVDTISGATPLGTLPATPNTAPNTVTNASGRLVNSVVGKVPTSNMSDTRIALNASFDQPVGDASSETIGGEVAKEHDFASFGANYTFNHDFFQKNTTLSFGASPEYDIVTPNGGLPVVYATQLAPGEFSGTHNTKYLVGGLIGLTQIINERTLMQWNYSPTYENGYLNDPYKLLSLINANGDPLSAIHENRPGSRLEHSFYWLTRYTMMGQDVFSLGLRYFADSWGIHSETLDFTYRWQYHERRFVEPHVRYYHQTAADFFRLGLMVGAPRPDFASADYRLNAIDGVTFGVRFGWTMQNGSELILRAEYYTQTSDDRPSGAVGLQRDYDLFPTLNATILQVEYKFEPSKLWSKKK
jgi:hypothetical protein